MDSSRGPGHLPRQCANHGQPGRPARGCAAGRGTVSRRAEPLPALALRALLRGLWLPSLSISAIRQFTTGRTIWSAECTTGGKEASDECGRNTTARRENGHPAWAGCPFCVGTFLPAAESARGGRSTSYNCRVVSSENCAYAGAPCIQQILCCRPPARPAALREVQVHP